MFPLLRTSLHNYHDLPFWFMLPKPSGDLGKGSPSVLLVDLGDFTRDRAKTVRTKKVSELVQSLD